MCTCCVICCTPLIQLYNNSQTHSIDFVHVSFSTSEFSFIRISDPISSIQRHIIQSIERMMVDEKFYEREKKHIQFNWQNSLLYGIPVFCVYFLLSSFFYHHHHQQQQHNVLIRSFLLCCRRCCCCRCHVCFEVLLL